ncbi:MAG: glycosyltransferase family 2 protein [Pseudomonadota bacterium]
MAESGSATNSESGAVEPNESGVEWPISDPNVLVATCMKNEGPFILEWVAWHKAIGVTNFIVYTNHCSDGTVEILDRLDTLGHVTHLENPAVAKGSTYFQPSALDHLHNTPSFHQADFVISMDVDEFINVRCGDGTMNALFEETGRFDVLSMSELNHGSNGHEDFKPGWVTEQFPKHQTERPGNWKAARGVKSITRLSGKVVRIRNHRPDVEDDALWVDGAGRPVEIFKEDPKKNGFDVRGTYKNVVLEHFPLRSLNSYLIKMDRGDVVIKGKQVSERYWRLRNQNGMQTSDLSRGLARMRAFYESEFATDPALMNLQKRAEDAHQARIAAIVDDEVYRNRKAWIFQNCW